MIVRWSPNCTAHCKEYQRACILIFAIPGDSERMSYVNFDHWRIIAMRGDQPDCCCLAPLKGRRGHPIPGPPPCRPSLAEINPVLNQHAWCISCRDTTANKEQAPKTPMLVGLFNLFGEIVVKKNKTLNCGRASFASHKWQILLLVYPLCNM